MPNPLKKDKVIQFIKRYPHDEGFSLLNNDNSVVVRPGDEGVVGENSGAIIPNPVIPSCSVGLEGTTGNPQKFEDLITMWIDPEERSKINPLGLMRLWAAIYRTYYEFATGFQRFLPQSTSTINSILTTIDPYLGYDVELVDGLGQYYSYNADTQALFEFQDTVPNAFVGAAVNAEYGVPIASNTTLKQPFNQKYINYRVVNDSDYASANGNQYMVFRETKTTEFLYDTTLTPNSHQNLVSYKAYGAEAKRGPFTLTIRFKQPTIIERVALAGSYINEAPSIVSTYPTVSQASNVVYSIHGEKNRRVYNFGAGNLQHFKNFVLKTSVDGTNFDEVLNYGNYYVDGPKEDTPEVIYYASSTGGPNPPAQGPGNTIQVGQVRHKTKGPSTGDTYYPDRWYSTDHINRDNGDYSRAHTFGAKVRSVDLGTNYANYSGVPNYTLGDSLIGNAKTIVQVTHNVDGVIDAELEVFNYADITKEAREFASFSFNTDSSSPPTAIQYTDELYYYEYYNDLYGAFWMLNPECPGTNNIWRLKHPVTQEVIVSGTFTFNVLDPNRFIQAFQLEYGPDDNVEDTEFPTGFAHPYIKGKAYKSVLNNSATSTFLTPRNTDFSDSFFTNNDPVQFQLSGLTVTDAIARDAFQHYPGLSNNIRWQVLPFTLPDLDISLESSLKTLASYGFIRTPDFNGLNFVGVEFNTDYISNRLIPIPTTQQEIHDIYRDSALLGMTPARYWHKQKFSELLTELVNHCKATCLKFWELNEQYSVGNFREYDELVLAYNPETRDIRELPGTFITGLLTQSFNNSLIRIFYMEDAFIDIEDSGKANRLWFLSGGGYTSVDLADNIISNLIEEILGENPIQSVETRRLDV